MKRYFHCNEVNVYNHNNPVLVRDCCPEDWNIRSLIHSEAECYANCHFGDDYSDEEFRNFVSEMEDEIWHDLNTHGLWMNEFNVPVFMCVNI